MKTERTCLAPVTAGAKDVLSPCFSVHAPLLADQIYATQIQQQLWIPLVGHRARGLFHPVIHTLGSSVDDLCHENHSRDTETGTVICVLQENRV